MVFTYEKNADGHYVCGICKEVKEKQNTMHYHLQKHEGKMPHACSHCEKRFYQKYALDDHIKLRHSTKPIEANIKCPFDTCTEKFHKKEHCRVHIARNHLREYLNPWIQKAKDSKIHTCGCCKNTYNSYPAILYHVMDHAKETSDPVLKAKLAII
jgi:KRAB domain-containing zinc finger protein